MNLDSKLLYNKLADNSEMENCLYRYGFLVTNNPRNYKDEFHFLGSWHTISLQNINFWIHPDQKFYHYSSLTHEFFLIGHCYNPYRMMWDEDLILAEISQALQEGERQFYDFLAELTGVFVIGFWKNNNISVFSDATGMFITYYGIINDQFYFGSHSDLIANINGLNYSEYVSRLVQYKFYPLFGRALPGDISPFCDLKRLVPNHKLVIQNNHTSILRFYPDRDWNHLIDAYSIPERVSQISSVLRNTMELIPQKWDTPAISLTGGCDSKTTLACTVGQYEKYKYFSYISQESEKIDANGAHIICNNLNLPHTIYTIPDNFDAEIIDLAGDIISANQGHIGKLGTREVQKRYFLSQQKDFDVEVKSWVSEIARTYYHKRFKKANFPNKPTPRYLTTLYKVFFHNRKLVKETDQIFAEYIDQYLFEPQLHNWSWIDLFFWEFRVSSWNGLVITGEHRFSGEITIPYNNRKLLETMIAVPVNVRMEDQLYKFVRDKTNPKVDQSGVSIVNLKHTDFRAKLERLYLEIHSRL